MRSERRHSGLRPGGGKRGSHLEHKMKTLQKLSTQENNVLQQHPLKVKWMQTGHDEQNIKILNEDRISILFSLLIFPFTSEPTMGQPGTDTSLVSIQIFGIWFVMNFFVLILVLKNIPVKYCLCWWSPSISHLRLWFSVSLLSLSLEIILHFNKHLPTFIKKNGLYIFRTVLDL